MGDKTKYTDKNNNVIESDSRLKDDENFIWEVTEKDGDFILECLDLGAEEPIYPRAKFCTIIRD